MIDQAGQLDRRIEFYRRSDTVDAFGQNTNAFVTTGLFAWAKIVEKSGKEGEEGNQIVATKKVEFIVRYNESILETWRILYDSQFYFIEAILSADERNSFLKLVTRWED